LTRDYLMSDFALNKKRKNSKGVYGKQTTYWILSLVLKNHQLLDEVNYLDQTFIINQENMGKSGFVTRLKAFINAECTANDVKAINKLIVQFKF
jgi:hypothetical protein